MRADWMRILTDEGVVDTWVTSDEMASLIGSHWNAVRDYLYARGDRLDEFQGVRINRHRLLTDPDAIDELERRGDLDDIDSIYVDGSE